MGHRVSWIPESLRDSLAVVALVGTPSFRVVSALQDYLAVEAFMVHRLFKGKSHFPTVSGMPLQSVRDALAVEGMICSSKGNPVSSCWSAGASTSSCLAQGSPRSQASVCRGICITVSRPLFPPHLQKWSTSLSDFVFFLLPSLAESLKMP